jgi:hypothetical protein
MPCHPAYESLIFGNIIVANVKQTSPLIEKEELALPQLKETNIAAVYDLGGVKARLRPTIGKNLAVSNSSSITGEKR